MKFISCVSWEYSGNWTNILRFLSRIILRGFDKIRSCVPSIQLAVIFKNFLCWVLIFYKSVTQCTMGQFHHGSNYMEAITHCLLSKAIYVFREVVQIYFMEDSSCSIFFVQENRITQKKINVLPILWGSHKNPRIAWKYIVSFSEKMLCLGHTFLQDWVLMLFPHGIQPFLSKEAICDNGGWYFKTAFNVSKCFHTCL